MMIVMIRLKGKKGRFFLGKKDTMLHRAGASAPSPEKKD